MAQSFSNQSKEDEMLPVAAESATGRFINGLDLENSAPVEITSGAYIIHEEKKKIYIYNPWIPPESGTSVSLVMEQLCQEPEKKSVHLKPPEVIPSLRSAAETCIFTPLLLASNDFALAHGSR